jgi:hypothetical protein
VTAGGTPGAFNPFTGQNRVRTPGEQTVRTAMIPTAPTPDQTQPIQADDTRPRFFLDDSFNPDTDGDWWLDLGRVDLPGGPNPTMAV